MAAPAGVPQRGHGRPAAQPAAVPDVRTVIKIFLMRWEFPMSTTFHPSAASGTIRLSRPLVQLCLVLGLAAMGCAADNTPPPAAPLATYWPVELAATARRIEIYQPHPDA